MREPTQLWLKFGTILVFLLLSSFGASKPLHLDEMDFPAVAQAASRTGLPIYYRGEGQEHWSGLYHPPLYIYSLAWWFKIFGYGILHSQMLGVTSALM